MRVLIEELLDTLSGEGLQSDERFAESFVHHSLNKGQGPNKITQELRQRGVEPVVGRAMPRVRVDRLDVVGGRSQGQEIRRKCALAIIKLRQNNLDSYIVAVSAVNR